jgi:hypothetical protein
VRRSEALLREIAATTRELRKSHAIQAPESILSTEDDRESVLSQAIWSKDVGPSFDAVILGTKVYANAFSGAIGPADDHEADDAKTILDTPFKDTVLKGAPPDAAEISLLAIHAASIQPAIAGLDVVNILAVIMRPYQATSDEELDCTKYQRIYDLQRVTKSRYRGYVSSGPLGSKKIYGHFKRDKVLISFVLRQPLEISTQAAFTYQDSQFATVNHRISMNITVSPSTPNLLGI